MSVTEQEDNMTTVSDNIEIAHLVDNLEAALEAYDAANAREREAYEATAVAYEELTRAIHATAEALGSAIATEQNCRLFLQAYRIGQRCCQ